MKVEKGSYKNIKASVDASIEKQYPLLDTRIIGIANATANIEEALFRRFLHIIIEEVMMVSDPPKQLADMRNCLSVVTNNVMGGANQFLANLEFKLLSEVNLQWQFNFFPKLINRNDGQNNYIIQNLQRSIASAQLGSIDEALQSDFSVASNRLFEKASDTALFKIIRNNYGIDDEMGGNLSNNFQAQIYGCLVSEVLSQSGGIESIVSEGSKAADVGSEQLTKDANAEIIQEALELFADNAVEASKYIIANNLKEFTEMEQNNAAIIGYVTNTLQLIEAGKGTSVQDNLFTGLMANAYASVMFCRQATDFKLSTSTYINQFSLLAQQEGFDYNKSDESITKQALKALELDGDTLKLSKEGKASKIDKFNEEMSLNAAMVMKKQGEISSKEGLQKFLKEFGAVGKRGLDSQWIAFSNLFSDAVENAVKKGNVAEKYQDKRS